METRQITETKIFLLLMNPMRGYTENTQLMAMSFEKQKLIDWHNSFLAPEPYTDNGSPSFECHGDSHNWHKVFKKDSPLEWYNPVENFDSPNHHGQGIQEEWLHPESKLNNKIPFIQ